MARQSPPQLIVAGTCGLTISVPINGVDVRFVCSPSVDPAPGPGGKPPVVVTPVDPGGGHVDYLTLDPNEWLRPEHFAPATEIDPDAEPRVVAATAGQPIDIDALLSALLAAREEGRPLMLEVRPNDL